jgi:hypothetical protein
VPLESGPRNFPLGTAAQKLNFSLGKYREGLEKRRLGLLFDDFAAEKQ